MTYKHLLLPIWLLTVIYEQKPFQVYINGVTGEVHGARPYSKVKILAAVARSWSWSSRCIAICRLGGRRRVSARLTASSLVAVVAIVGFGVALTVRSKKDFDDANEVVPGGKSAAPASWAGAHSPEAKLHRRLGDAVRAARNNPASSNSAWPRRPGRSNRGAGDRRAPRRRSRRYRVSPRSDAVAALEPPVAALEEAVATLVTSTTVDDSRELLEQTCQRGRPQVAGARPGPRRGRAARPSGQRTDPTRLGVEPSSPTARSAARRALHPVEPAVASAS